MTALLRRRPSHGVPRVDPPVSALCARSNSDPLLISGIHQIKLGCKFS
eukprot:CAMPEP_0175216318 /NCGR_PEP_ID=MMETSP0093-20121207/17666_1 /TAXON_ID=311494 /ORGANISM="Alexandrium monilatum, Strain CCMP3105" /LENGTH=47 /DNA_ID= /DNA_START= /DNA_END= /DNA_ORIENTATION=